MSRIFESIADIFGSLWNSLIDLVINCTIGLARLVLPGALIAVVTWCMPEVSEIGVFGLLLYMVGIAFVFFICGGMDVSDSTSRSVAQRTSTFKNDSPTLETEQERREWQNNYDQTRG